MVIKKNLKKNNVIKDEVKKEEIKKFFVLNSLFKIVLMIFILSIMVSSVINISQSKESVAKDQNTITVSGHGEVNVKPDTTKFTISVNESGKDLKSAQDAVANKINSALAILKQNGVSDKNIKTTGYNTYPKYSSRTVSCAPAVLPVMKGKTTSSVAPTAPTLVAGKGVGVSSSGGSTGCVDRVSEIVGYDANQSIEVKITDISKNPDLAGTLVSAIGKAGVEISGLTNYVDNMEKVKQLARDQAIQKAKIQAEDIATSLGVRLGKITSFSENSNGGYPYPVMMSAKMVGASDSAAANLPVGEKTLTSDVSIGYSIK